MAKVEIKLADRKAGLLLACNDCIVRLYGSMFDYTTKQGVKYTGHSKEVFINELGDYVNIRDIKEIKYTDRFGNTSFMGVDWND